MSPTCFEPEASCSGRLLYIQLLYGTLYMYQYKQSSVVWSVLIMYSVPYSNCINSRLHENEHSG